MKEETGVTAKNIAKRLLDFGMHSPTVYFPQIIEEAMMFEPTESEPVEELDRLVKAMVQISEEAYSNPQLLIEAPHNTAIGPLNEAQASHPRTMCVSWRAHVRRMHTEH
jgi:glycine dehydrogenase subunit 2